jgi:hypothetical protein
MLRENSADRLWDAVAHAYVREFSLDPKPSLFTQILSDWRSAGIQYPLAYYRLISELQDKFGHSMPSVSELSSWVRWLNSIDSEYQSVLKDGKLVIQEACAKLLAG